MSFRIVRKAPVARHARCGSARRSVTAGWQVHRERAPVGVGPRRGVKLKSFVLFRFAA
jgi:hypothetical protein